MGMASHRKHRNSEQADISLQLQAPRAAHRFADVGVAAWTGGDNLRTAAGAELSEFRSVCFNVCGGHMTVQADSRLVVRNPRDHTQPYKTSIGRAGCAAGIAHCVEAKSFQATMSTFTPLSALPRARTGRHSLAFHPSERRSKRARASPLGRGLLRARKRLGLWGPLPVIRFS